MGKHPKVGAQNSFILFFFYNPNFTGAEFDSFSIFVPFIENGWVKVI